MYTCFLWGTLMVDTGPVVLKHPHAMIPMRSSSVRTRLHRAHQKQAHDSLVIAPPPAGDASQEHTKSYDVISGVSQTPKRWPTSQTQHWLKVPRQLRWHSPLWFLTVMSEAIIRATNHDGYQCPCVPSAFRQTMRPCGSR